MSCKIEKKTRRVLNRKAKEAIKGDLYKRAVEANRRMKAFKALFIILLGLNGLLIAFNVVFVVFVLNRL